MNILILSWRGPNHPNAGGAEISTHEHAKGWVKFGHKVTLFTSNYIGGKEYERIDGVQIIRRGKYFFGVQFEALKWYLFQNHSTFDLVVDQFHGIPFFTPLYIKSKKMAFIHEVAKEVWKLNSWPKPYNLLPAVLGTILEPLIFKLFYKNIPFMTVSESTKKDLILWGIPSPNITVIHNGISSSHRLEKFIKEKDHTLIFLGAISRDKGIEDALKVFSIIHAKEKKSKLWVVGKGEKIYLDYLKLLCRKLNVEGSVTFTGFVTEREKFRFLSKSHLLINTSIREGWGLVIIEAASVGTPAVAFDVPGLRDSIKDKVTGLLCEERDVNKLAKIINNTLANKDLLTRLSKNAYQWSKQFSWIESISLSLRLIKKIAG